MKHHPFTDVWPLLDGKDFDDLKADIEANGLRLPILIYKDQILDGRNRERACEEIGMPARYEQADAATDDEALNLVVSLNMRRRHLTLAQRGFAAEKIATLRVGRPRLNRSKDPISNSDTNTLRQAAAQVGVSYGSAKRARQIRTHGTEADVADVLAGKIPLTTRATELTLVRNPRPPRIQHQHRRSSRRMVFAGTGPMPALTQQEVDPEFKGTPMEWVDKYGHVQVKTAEEYATMRFSDWVSVVRVLAKSWREQPELRNVDHNWLRSPRPIDIAKLTEALEFLRPRIAEAEALLACAVAAVRKKQEA
jgi:hypothetical protein